MVAPGPTSADSQTVYRSIASGADRGVPEQAAGPDPGARPDVRPPLQVRAGHDRRVRAPASRPRRSRSTAGSMIVTPARIQSSSRRLLRARRAWASCTWSFTPWISAGSAARTVPARWPSPRRMATTSVRYSWPCALLVATPLDRVGQQRPVKGVAAGVDLADRPLPGGGVGVLDDLGQRAAAVPDDAPVAGRIRDQRGEHGHRVARRGVLADQRGQRLRPQQGHVPVGHHDDAGQVTERLGHHADRVAGAALPVLHHHLHVRAPAGRLRR